MLMDQRQSESFEVPMARCVEVCRISCWGSMYCRNDSLIAICLQPLLQRPAQRTKANSYRFRYCQVLGFVQLNCDGVVLRPLRHCPQRYARCNIEIRSCNHCCSRKAISITYSECAFIALGIQHATRVRHIDVCGLSGSTVLFHISCT
jgi:hypothetical protein